MTVEEAGDRLISIAHESYPAIVAKEGLENDNTGMAGTNAVSYTHLEMFCQRPAVGISRLTAFGFREVGTLQRSMKHYHSIRI